MSNARAAFNTLEDTRRLANLCAAGQHTVVAMEIVNRFDSEGSRDFLLNLREHYVSEEEYQDLKELVETLME